MKKFFYWLIGLVVITVAALLVGPGLWDWSGYKPDILERFKAETGRHMAIDGDLSLAILPSPRFAVDGVRIANIEGATAAEFAQFKSLSVRIRLMPLLSGRIEVESVELINPVLELESLPDGRVNWAFGRPAMVDQKKVSKGAADRTTPTGEPSAGGQSFTLDRLVIRGGRLVYRNAAEGTVERLENLDVEGFAGSLAGPFGMKGALTLRGFRLDISMLVGQLDEGGPVPLDLRLAHVGADAKALISGGIELGKLVFRGKVEFSGSDIGSLTRAVSAGKAELPVWLGQKFSLASRVEASPAGVSIDDIDLRIGGTSASGGINAVFGERIRIDVALKAKLIDLDKWLAQVSHRVDVGPGGNSGGATGRAAQSTAGATFELGDGFVLPAAVDGALNVSIEAVAFKGRQMREITLSVSLDHGTAKLSRLSGRLPGGGTVLLTGSLTSAGGKVSYRGETTVRADNLRAVLDWLDADVAHVPADRLHRFQLKTMFDGNQELVQIADLEMRLDSSRIRGGITYALRRRPAFGARITVDQFNLDAYLPRPRAVGAMSAKTDQLGATPSPGITASSDGPASSSSPFAMLGAFDANVVLRVGTLNYRRTPIQGLFIDIGLVGGTLTIRQASVRNISGTTGRIAGTLGGFPGFPVFNGSFSASSKNVAELFRIAGIESPIVPRKLGRLKLTGKTVGGADKIKLQSTLEFAGAKIELAGKMTELGASPLLKLDLRARHPEGAKLARLFGTEMGATGRGLGKFDLEAEAKGRLDGLDLAIRLSAVDAEITFGGKVIQPLARPKLTGTLEVRHPDFVQLARTFDWDYYPAKSVTGPFWILSRITATHTASRFDDLKGQIGATLFNGAADIGLSGPKPTVTAKLIAGDIDLNTLLPIGEDGGRPVPASPVVVAASAVPTKGKSGARRYSRELIDWSVFGSFDGDVELSASSIIWRTIRIDTPRLTAKLQDSVLAVSELTGRMFGGGFELDALLDGRRAPKFNGTVKIAEANLGKALIAGHKYAIIKGILDLDMKLTTVGRSQHEMVSALAGQGRFAVRDGIVTGVDLQAVSDRLSSRGQLPNFLTVFARAMGGGSTKFSVLDGTMRIDKGVIRTGDLRIISEAGQGEAKGTTDLARWYLNVRALIRPAGSNKLPPFHVHFTGPPDHPNKKIDFAALRQFLVGRINERGVGSLLNKALPRPPLQRQSEAQASSQGKSTPEVPLQEAPSSELEKPPPREINPEDFIRSLLKGLQR